MAPELAHTFSHAYFGIKFVKISQLGEAGHIEKKAGVRKKMDFNPSSFQILFSINHLADHHNICKTTKILIFFCNLFFYYF